MSQITNTVLMVSPDSFAYDEETAISNTFQKNLTISQEDIQKKALDEFNEMVNQLKENLINVLVIPSVKGNVPDSVFPNNWFSTDDKGNLVVYSMLAESRRKEIQIDILKQALIKNGYEVKKTINFKNFQDSDMFLEGTGSMTLDHIHHVVYAILSARTHIIPLEYFCSAFGYTLVYFNATDLQGIPIYHTNVLMNIGDGFAVCCNELIQDEHERKNVQAQLEKNNFEVVDITYEQMTKFCGNILQVENINSERKIIMSDQAYNSFSKKQIDTLEKYGGIIHSNIETIETIGGGSARCMLAEIFLPKIN
ncbi:MAG TPA: arginine deiminase-related protein [Candidatus Nitrosocosmicus sp.]|nr:arginine deiminase-related protein [Candidatus Nitrosocosmicus sp.]